VLPLAPAADAVEDVSAAAASAITTVSHHH
jgi:hypothetical protein